MKPSLQSYLRERGKPPAERGFSPLSETLTPFPVLLRAAALRTCMSLEVFNCSKAY